MELVIGVDIGTSGIRAQAVNAEKKEVISTAITLHSPLPGTNSVDHLHFALRAGIKNAQKIMINAINALLNALEVDLKQVKRLAVCGNPTQLSIFQGIEFRDLLYGGDRLLRDLGLKRLDRRSQIISNSDIGLVINSEAEICIPPAVRQQVGADALAMLIQAKILERRDNCMITDYGTNAEIALKVGDIIYTGSCAAGPAIEGGEIEKGVLASPGAVCDISQVNLHLWKIKVLDKDMYSKDSYVVDPVSGEIFNKLSTYTSPVGITGTGTIALVATGLECGLIKRVPPFIITPNHRIHLSRIHDIFFTDKDYVSASRCFEAFKAGHTALIAKSGISFSDINAMYMCGAGGTYVEVHKAQIVGIVPPTVSEVYQIGNTSLAMAVNIAIDPTWLDTMQSLADSLKGAYVDFATDKIFQQSYVLEMEYFERGLKLEDRPSLEDVLGLPHYPLFKTKIRIHITVKRDIPEFGKKGLHVIAHTGVLLSMFVDGCTGCRACEEACLTKALKVVREGDEFKIVVASEKCAGYACMKCELACKKRVFRFDDLKLEPSKKAWI